MGVDFIKVDDIAYSTIYRDSHRKEIEGIRKAIDKTGREIVLSLSPGPARLQDGSFLQKNANMWRLTDDFWDSGNCSMICSIVVIIGRHLSVKETGLIAICFRLDILESVPVSVERQTV